MKIALTGSSGFLGRNFLRSYTGEANILVRRKSQTAQPGVQQIVGDLNQSDFSEFTAGTDVLVHLACSLAPRSKPEDAEEEYRLNLSGSQRIFESFKKHNPTGKIIFFSSGGAVYDNSENRKMQETDKTLGLTPYGKLKIQLEQNLQDLVAGTKMQAMSLRVSNPYGELFSSERKQGFIGVALSAALNDTPLTIFENKRTVRDYIHIDDLNALLNRLILEDKIPPGKHEIYNVGTGQGTSLQSLIEDIERATGKVIDKSYVHQDTPPTFNTLDIEKIRGDFNWTPQISVFAGLQKSLNK